MTNHAFIYTKKNLVASDIESHLNKLVSVYDSALKIECPANDCWRIQTTTSQPYGGLEIWIACPRRLEMRKGHGSLSLWIQAYIQESLAAQLKGRCSDEGVQGTWRPEPEKFDTYEKWWRSTYELKYCDESLKLIIKDMWERELKWLPESLLVSK
jgi:hypothetical protein